MLGLVPQYVRRKAWNLSFKLLGERAEYYRDRMWRRWLDHGRRKRWVVTPIDALFGLLEFRRRLPDPIIALEFFGRHGLWKTVDYADRCEYLEHYEIEAPYARFAERVLPKTKTRVVCADSIAAVQNGKLLRSDYSFVVIDSKEGMFGGYCEHFDVIGCVFPYLADRSVVVTNIFYDLIAYYGSLERIDKEQIARRRAFYGVDSDAAAIRLEIDVIERTYRDLVPAGFVLDDLLFVHHPGPNVFVALCLRRQA